MPKDRSRVIASEPDLGAVRMETLFHEGTKLTAVQTADALNNHQLRTCLDLQQGMGRNSIVLALLQ